MNMMKDLCIENDKTLLWRIKKLKKKWRDIPYTWIGKFNMNKMSTFSELICRFSEVSNKIKAYFLMK